MNFGSGGAAQPRFSCPFCGGGRTEVMSPFGSHASLTTCWCAECRSPFEVLRWRDEDGRKPAGFPAQCKPRRKETKR